MSEEIQPLSKKRRLSDSSADTEPEKTKLPRKEAKMQRAIASFALHPLSKYRRACPTYKEPHELLSFSYDNTRSIQMDDRELKYYYKPCISPPPSLFTGFSEQVRRDHTINEHIDGLTTALSHLHARSLKVEADFVMYRGMLTRIFVTPFSLREAWSMNATRIGKTVFIEDNVTEDKLAERLGSSETHRRMMYSGYKFEALSVIDAPPESLTPEQLQSKLSERLNTIVDTNSEYCSVFRTKLGSHSIISGAEVDCTDRSKPAEFPNRFYRELKTSRILDSEKAHMSFNRFKLLKFWAQSFIAGIPVVTVGFRDDEGRLVQVRDFKTREMPRMVRDKPRMWEANVCMNFADQLLQFIKQHVVAEGPDTQYRINCVAWANVRHF
ncbi:RAI1 like PD-XK nuclease-domain-containing protein [Coemansia mojavensis]|nr:RAI1 like PD-XK nuclease-domain-containing protein [Coemansia mojavensis]